jgi:signal transduction histidine kinase
MLRPDILIVDDEPDLREIYGRVLSREGYRVRYAGSARECLDALAAAVADLVLLDVVLPDGNGMDLCRELKAHPGYAGTFVIHVSGQRISPDDLATGLEAGADGYLTKPLNHRTLIAHVKALMRMRAAERALRESEEAHRLLVVDLKEANQRLQEYNRLKAEFVANISHELRTPLTAIIGFAQLSRMRPGDTPLPPLAADAFDRILRNGRHLLALIDDVLDLSKIEAGRMPLHCEHFDIGEVVQDAFGQLQTLAQQKGLHYQLSIGPDLGVAYSDPRRIRQILVNLLSNALKFTSAGCVRTSLSVVDADRFQLEVSDTGIGIEPAAQALIFDRFRQVDGSTTRSAGGVGLGLAIVRQLATLLGGDVALRSTPGEGSTFTVTLPLRAPTSRAAAEEPRPGGVPLPAAPNETIGPQPENEAAPLILIIEDDIDCAELLTRSVADAGYRVRVATDGVTGLRLVRELLPAAVLLDVMMPGMDGWRVLREIKADPRVLDIPIIVCSIVDNRALGYQLGASSYLLKPVDPHQLTDSLRSLNADSGSSKEDYVLVVDDEHGIRELLTKALRESNFNVRSAASGAAALKLARSAVPQAILCDLMMPGGMSGFELIARIRADEHLAHVPLLVITGKDLTSSDRRLIAGQLANVIRKGDLLMSDLGSRLRRTLQALGVAPPHGPNPAD